MDNTVTARVARASAAALLLSLAIVAAGCSSANPAAPSPTTGTPPSAGGDPGTTATPPPATGTPPPAGGAPTPPAAPATARYRFTFDALWSSATHPRDFPGDPHFSPVVGGTHGAVVRFWREGAVATDGIRDMAERGLTVRLEAEIRAAIGAGTAQHLILGGGIGRSPGSVSLEFEISQTHGLVTIVSMVAPSPDWFTGVSGLALFENNQWIDRRSVELAPWDAGTDSGTTFTSPDQATNPRQPIARITGFPFELGGQVAPVARFTFERIQ